MKLPFFVGSLPFQSVKEAIQFVKENSPHLPFLPQLPELNPQEDMIGQVLRGFELGYWDEKASIALEAFQNEFCESPRFKIQIAGPYTVSRTLSLPLSEIYPQWEALVLGISKQLRQGAFLGELWLQIDEPFWPPKGTALLLRDLEKKIPKSRLGVHSCATERPTPDAFESRLFRFFSLDCSRTPFMAEEKAFWEKWLKEDPTRVFVWGYPQDSAQNLDSWPLENPQIWLSAPCGLYGQSL
ncbi:hypothetical protein EBT16_01970 [bacterium]|nr:hypothetical protein [bacterium]